ncbi:MAG: acyl-CoA thioesterase [Draconibacterium sp.]|nr:acyl-CoA thioesterase [Draconibacterium sp.]
MKKFDFQLEMQVRDYECDIQGIVNNAVYQNYLEHCRHKFLNSVGLDFTQAHNDGIDGVVIRAELDYKFPLRPGDEFIVGLKMAKKGKLRLIFDQQIIRKADDKLMVAARITTVLTKNNRPISSDYFVEKMEKAGISINEV